MQVVQVTNTRLAKAFRQVNVEVNKGNPNYIQPLDKDIEDVFDPGSNKAFQFGEIIRWLLQDDSGSYIGRVAAFVHSKYTNKGDTFKVGGMGFFDCIDDQQAANMLFDTARDWLKDRGCEAMDGPINFGERDRWWGLLIEGFQPPLYAMNYNPPYYRRLFEQYGFRVFFNQICWERSVAGRLEQRFYDAHDKIAQRGGFRAERVRKKELEKYANDFATIYNKAWASHMGGKEMAPETAVKLFRKMSPIMDEDICWMTYYREEPIAFYINLPDLNQIFRHFHGRFGVLEKLRFLYYRSKGEITKFTGIIFGVVPRFQGMGVDYYMIVEAAKVIQGHTKYTTTELQWQGDFNPKILNISKNLGFRESRRLATFRYLFDRNRPFERHPTL